MRKALLLVPAALLCAPAPAADAVCVESQGSSIRLHSGACGEITGIELDSPVLDRILCTVDELSSSKVIYC